MISRGRRAGQYARSQARHQHTTFVRTNWRVIALIFVSVYLVTFIAHRLLPHPFSNVFVGAMLMVPPWIVSLMAVSRPGTAAWARGADAEEWTGAALRRALPKGYRILNDVQLTRGNADHVVVGPADVFVIETKWRGEPWKSPAGYGVIRGACGQVRQNARLVARLLADHGIEVVPQTLVVLWGGGCDRWSARTIEHVPVVAGQRIKEWVQTLNANDVTGIDPDAIANALRTVTPEVSKP